MKIRDSIILNTDSYKHSHRSEEHTSLFRSHSQFVSQNLIKAIDALIHREVKEIYYEN